MSEYFVLSSFGHSLMAVLSFKVFIFLLYGVGIGFVVGLLPGLGTAATLAIMIPFTFGMEPLQAFAFLIGMLSVTATAGDLTSVLFGVPGEATSAALVMDGFKLTKNNEAGRAIGAALASSLLGAIIGAAALALAIPFVRPLVLLLGSAEFFMLTILGLSFVVSLSRGNQLKGIASALMGLMLASVGIDPQSGVARFTLGQIYLWDGVSLIGLAIGLFAIPEIIDMVRHSAAPKPERIDSFAGVVQGVRDTFRNRWLTIRCSLIGVVVGVIPGLGGSVAQWISYAHVSHSMPHLKLGTGVIEGVIGPGAANNSKEGGNLLPLIMFGLPSTVSMAILLSAFTIHGLAPGPNMLTKHIDITTSFVWMMVISNVICVAICFVLIRPIVGISYIRVSLLVPLVILLVMLGTYAEKNFEFDFIVLVLFGLMGLVMTAYDWPRPPFILGFVLGGIAENNLFLSISRYGSDWISQPGVLIIGGITLVILFLPTFRRLMHRKRFAAEAIEMAEMAGDAPLHSPRSDFIVALGWLAVAGWMVVSAQSWDLRASLYPTVIGLPLVVFLTALVVLSVVRVIRTPESTSEQLRRFVAEHCTGAALGALGWVIAAPVMIHLLGFMIGGAMLTLACLLISGRERIVAAVAISAAVFAFFYCLQHYGGLPLPRGTLLTYIGV